MSQESISQTSISAPDMITGVADLSGRTLGDFQLVRRLGAGGMGQVYLAEQLSLKRKVALKLLRPELAANPTSLVRFQNEAEAVARITHPNIVQVHAIGAQDGLRYMALEYVDGWTLKEYVARKGPPDVPLVLSIMRQVTAALERAAEAGIIHRDIKPENILLTRKGEVKVADFGLSRCFDDPQTVHLTQSGVTMGTPLYMSPEQVQGYPLDPRSDIYSFGVTCYHMLTGEPPFQGQTAFEVALQHVQAQPRPLHEVRPDLPADLTAVVERMMAKKPDERYASAQELHQDINRLRASFSRPMEASKSAVVTAPATAPRRSGVRLRWLVTASVGGAVIAGSALGWLSNRPAAHSAVAREAMPAETPEQKREHILLETIHLYDNPADNRAMLLGLEHRLELGVLYLEQHRLDDADRFFTALAKTPGQVEAYRLLGRMGQAIVLAYRDQAKESVAIFSELFVGWRPNPVRRLEVLVANRSPRFRRQLAEAMERNASNLPTYPSELRRLLKVGPLQAAASRK